MHAEEPQRAPQRFVNALDTLMGVTVSTLPLILVVLGIGMMSFAPRRSTVPLFRSPSEAQEFYQQHDLQLSYEQPIIIVESACPSCSSLTTALKDLGISFIEQSIDGGNRVALALRAQAGKVSGSQDLPQVVLGDQLINPAPHSVKIALRRFQK